MLGPKREVAPMHHALGNVLSAVSLDAEWLPRFGGKYRTSACQVDHSKDSLFGSLPDDHLCTASLGVDGQRDALFLHPPDILLRVGL